MKNLTMSVPFAMLLLTSMIYGQCPAPTNYHFAQGKIVYFSLGNISPTSTEGQQIVAASVAWNQANVNSNNNSGILFYQANAQNPAVWTFNNGTTQPNTAASTSWTYGSDGMTFIGATTTIGIDTTYSNTGNPIFSSSQAGYSTAFQKNAEHEFGHGMGLSDVTGSAQVPGDTVMNQFYGTNDSGNYVALSLTTDPCKDAKIVSVSSGSGGSGGSNGGGQSGNDGGQCSNSETQCPSNESWQDYPICACSTCMPPESGCGWGEDWQPFPTCACVIETSPIVVDTTGAGFHFTSADDGVMFDISGNGHKIKLGWPASDSGNGWLALPRNGQVTTGKELFGNFTPQPPSAHPNGFLALAVYDAPENGGNGDGVIDGHDTVWPSLRIWIDTNHDGIAQPDELHPLPSLGIYSISVAYTDVEFADAFGNRFRYKGMVNPAGSPFEDNVDRTIYDVILNTQRTNTQSTLAQSRAAKKRLNPFRWLD